MFSPWGREYFSLILQVDKGTTKLAYMRAALSSLASIHGITFSFMKSIGGREALLEQFHTIKEHHLPRNKVVRNMLEEAMLPFLMYMTRVQPDIAQQLMVKILFPQPIKIIIIHLFIEVLAKFQKFLYRVYKDLQKKESLSRLKTLVHGDAKIDNFMLKKVYGETDVFSAMIIDWQGCCFDR